jgi:DNA ligase-1
VIEFARTAQAVAAISSKLEKIALIASYLRALEHADLAPAARYFTGNPLPAFDERKLAIGGRTLIAAATRVWGIDGTALSAAYRATGDLGAALGTFARKPLDLGLFHEQLTPSSFSGILDELASASGKSAAKRRQLYCERILGACESVLEATYVIKILTGELRIGLREGLIVDAVASAFERDPQHVRRALMAAGDIGLVAERARTGTLDEIEVRYGVPIGFMLATPIAYGSGYRELAAANWLCEDKYDGIRAQAHKFGNHVRIFSRTLNESGDSFPEVVGALAACEGDFIIDGEIIAQRDGEPLPFRYLQPRLQRKDPSPELLGEVPVTFVAFDVLALQGRFLLDEPLVERRSLLATALHEGAHLQLAPWSTLEAGAAAAIVEERFEQARARGNEGLMLKRTDAPYAPGRRGRWWHKLKRELSTLDVVVVGVQWGHGKRHNVLSDYTFAVRRSADSDELVTIGKAYSGLTDAEIATMTEWFLNHRTGELGRHVYAVAPEVVIEVAFDIIQKSDLHAGGFSLRFPRIVRLRPDKPAHEADTLAEVERIYREMLEREGVAH